MTDTRRCAGCGQVKPLTDFQRYYRKYRQYCQICRDEWKRQHRNARMRAYWQKHSKEIVIRRRRRKLERVLERLHR